MRTKILQKKLVLNKKTIVNLGNDDLGKVKGGIVTVVTCRGGCTDSECETCYGTPSVCAPCSLGCPPTYWC
jgi:hypothetical protein